MHSAACRSGDRWLWPDQGDGLTHRRGWRALACTSMASNCTGPIGASTHCIATRMRGCTLRGIPVVRRRALALGDAADAHSERVNTGLSGISILGNRHRRVYSDRRIYGRTVCRVVPSLPPSCPLFRSHGRDWRLHLPWGWNTGENRLSGNQGLTIPIRRSCTNPAIEPVCRKYLELRYRLMPYLYSRSARDVRDGTPHRPCHVAAYPDDPPQWRSATSTCMAAISWLRRWWKKEPPSAGSISPAAIGTTTDQ